MEAVGQLAGGIAHDFNNLLTGILGYSELLLMDMKPGQAGYEELSQIKNVSLRARDLVQGLLAFSRRAESHPRPINLNNEIQTVRKLLERTIPKTIEIQFRLAENLKIINADPSQMHQVLMNLAVNAHDAMPDGGQLLIETENVTLDEEYCRSHLGAKPGPYVLLSVSDTGIGMEQTIQNHIFEPFFTTKEKGKGTGLGLAIVWGIVKSLQGYIMVYSEPGQGTTFKIYLPVIESLVTESVEDTAVDLPRGQE
ncbi:MAG: ATP-binding protein, partial [candidate division KSB1 bacterium]|nr:ATP-binding protein [candidate division KSB1 bacterium]